MLLISFNFEQRPFVYLLFTLIHFCDLNQWFYSNILYSLIKSYSFTWLFLLECDQLNGWRGMSDEKITYIVSSAGCKAGFVKTHRDWLNGPSKWICIIQSTEDSVVFLTPIDCCDDLIKPKCIISHFHGIVHQVSLHSFPVKWKPFLLTLKKLQML